MERIDEIRKNYKFRKDEIFKRMKASTFAQLVLQVAQVLQVEQDRESLMTADLQRTIVPEEKESVEDGENVPPLNLGDDRPATSGTATSRSTLQSLIHGVGEIDVKDQDSDHNKSSEMPTETPLSTVAPDVESMPYLLLDLRDKEAFDKCHIIGALHYPSSMLSRSYNYFTKEILIFKNKLGKIIILYDEDERLAAPAATTFVQREVDNVFMLSGGLKVLAKKFAQGMITGTLPASCLPTPPPTRKGSGKSNRPGTVAPLLPYHVKYFTADHLERIQDALDDELLLQDSRMSSRVSSRSTASVASSRVSTATSTASKKPSWK
ncbi:centrosomal protein of 41 kDa B isoform X2 [Nematostella vectensis]|nr:centrosomal protein of 41 kDa B isoform X2 [Nematostella vectensis]